MQIPTLDLRDAERGWDTLARKVVDAFQGVGFAAFVGHGVLAAHVLEAYRVARELFALPDGDKRRYHVVGGAGARGYTPFGTENAKDQDVADLKEFWHVGRELGAGQAGRESYPPNLWPTEVAGFRPAMLSLYGDLDALGRRVLQLVATGLGLPKEYFDDKVDHGNSILRPLHYPPILGDGGGAVRAAAHEDINFITLLVGSQEPGLEVRLEGGSWIPAPIGEDLIICNVGDMLQRLTNHVLSSTTHRVVNPPAPACDRSRYSIPFFLHPNSELLLETLPDCITEERPNRYPVPILADAYLRERLVEIGLLSPDA